MIISLSLLVSFGTWSCEGLSWCMLGLEKDVCLSVCKGQMCCLVWWQVLPQASIM